MTKQPENAPGAATAEEGEVMMDGPDGVAVSLTPDAARRTAHSLRAAALEAKRQRCAQEAASSRGEPEDGGLDVA
ncbi:hypothetical protein BH10PSE15_BH10PSE15_07900 [soil metagenome]